MTRWRSPSSPSRSLALGLALAGGGCTVEFERDSAQVDLRLEQPGGLGFAIDVTARQRDELYLDLDAGLTNLGGEPCHLAVYLHTTEPVPEDMPALTGPPAPVIAGAELLFETVLAPPSEGREFTRRLASFELIADRVEASGERRRWVTIATCAAPTLQLELQLALQLQHLIRRPGERSATIEQIWP